MPRAKETIAEKPKDLTGSETKQDKGAEGAETPKIVPQTPPPKRAPGTKEVIPFQWKLVGEAGGLVFTLFKAVELEEVEGQLERLQKDSYYKELRILDVNEVVKQPPAAKQRVPRTEGARTKGAPKAGKTKATTSKSKASLSASKTIKSSKPAPSAKAAKVRKATKAAKRTGSGKASKPKATWKTAKKKTSTPKSTRKRTRRRK